MAFFISMPPDFKIGETRDCRINKQAERLTWRDKDTLLIEPGDARKIVYMDKRRDLSRRHRADHHVPAVTPEDIEKLKEFGRQIARLSPEQVEQRKWQRWVEILRAQADPLSHEATQDYLEDKDGLYR